MPPSTPKPLVPLYWSLLFSIVVAGLLVAGIAWLSVRMRSENAWVEHTLLVRSQIEGVLVLAERAETSQRGYLLTERELYLSPYENAAAELRSSVGALAALVADNPRQQENTTRLQTLIKEKLEELNSTIARVRSGDAAGALAIVNGDTGLRIMSEMRDLARSMLSEEQRLLAARESNARTLGLLLTLGAGLGFLLICGVGLLMSYLTRRSFVELAVARDQLSLTNADLLQEMRRREQAEIQLRQSQKMDAIGQLTGGIAHDFNNMLGVITGSLDLIRRRINKNDFSIERFVDAAQDASARAAALTSRLLAFARQQPLSPQPLDANKMIAGMSELLRSTLGEQIEIETVLAGGLWTARADPNQLENAILNIGINARDAMPEGGKLTIETGNAYLDDVYCAQPLEVEPGQYVMIALTDTGIGMTDDVAARAFDPFFTTKPTGRGTGLGLSQVYGFVKQSRGHIKIYSEVGSGTIVKLYLPRVVGAGRYVSAAIQAPARAAEPGTFVLVVEDDPLMRRLSAEALRELGYSVIENATGIEALDTLKSRPEIKLLFTDVVMPNVNGRKLADAAALIRPDLKVLFTTGYTQNAVVHGGVLDVGVHFLGKPFTLEQLATKIRAVLDG